MMNHVFGPVHSRRLGLSLGIDPVQHTTCSLDCVYCQLGATRTQTLERRVYATADAVVDEVRAVIGSGVRMDCITFSGTGEPTLNSDLGKMIARIKTLCSVPVVVITNSTLMHLDAVRSDLMHADIVIPSVNAASEAVFARLCRPLPGFDFSGMLQGLETFSMQYPGRLWVEVMLAAGINDSEDELGKLAGCLARLKCEKIQINTVTRPPAEKDCAAVSRDVLERARLRFGPRAEIIGEAKAADGQPSSAGRTGDILALVRSHPCTLEQLCRTLGLDRAPVEEALRALLAAKKIEQTGHGTEIFYRALGR